MRANGQVKFLKVSAKLQRTVAAVIVSALAIWLVATLAMLFNQYSISVDRMALVKKEAAIKNSEQRVADYRGSIDDVAKELAERQDLLDSLTTNFIGNEVVEAKDASGKDAELEKTVKEVSSLIPEAASLAELDARQLVYAVRLTRAANNRAEKAEAAIRKFGLNPDAMVRRGASAMGGPFIPFFGSKKKNELDPRFARLNSALTRMDVLERSLLAIPSGMPANLNMMSSGFGYRSDPFTRRGAMHSGLDFKGPYGQPILAAAKGKISFAGWKSGYGKAIEITHGNGMLTRYAHLSRIAVKTGQAVDQGKVIGKMGSTGRSTGTHLHFEVRLNNKAINPRPFLEANSDVLEVKANARQRTSAPLNGK